MSTPPDPAGDFRKTSTLFYRGFVVLLVLLAIGVAALGWWIGDWWGLAGGAAIGVALLIGGLVAGTLVWAMTQDGG